MVEFIFQLWKKAVSPGIKTGQKKAKIILETSLINDRLQIKVEDNGQGINWQNILDLAIKNKIVTRPAAKNLNLTEIKNLIFSAGISKGKALTTVSGRGMGLSLVKRKVDSLGANIEIISSLGKGTSFVIDLPLPLSVFRSIVFALGEFHFGIPLTHIHKLLKLDEVKNFLPRGKAGKKNKNFTFKKNKFKLVGLNKLFSQPDLEALYKYIILLKFDKNKLAIPIATGISEEELIRKKTPLVGKIINI